jgi:hypothetical protein
MILEIYGMNVETLFEDRFAEAELTTTIQKMAQDAAKPCVVPEESLVIEGRQM